MSDKRVSFLEEGAVCRAMTVDYAPRLRVIYTPDAKGRVPEPEEMDVAEFIAVKGFKAKGKRLSGKAVEKVEWLDPAEEEPDYEALLQERLAAASASTETAVESGMTDGLEGGDDVVPEQLSLEF